MRISSPRGDRFLVGSTFALLLLWADASGQSPRKLVGSGSAAGTNSNSVQEARIAAQQQALGEACAAVLGQTGFLERTPEAWSKILREPGRFIRDSRVVKEEILLASGVSVCDIEVEVDFAAIESELRTGTPFPRRIVVVVTQDLDPSDNKPPLQDLTWQAKIESQLIKAGFSPIDRETARERLGKEIDVARLEDEVGALCAYMRTLDAEYLLHLSIEIGRPRKERLGEPVNTDVFVYPSQFALRLVELDTARVAGTSVIVPDESLKSVSPSLPPKVLANALDPVIKDAVTKFKRFDAERKLSSRPIDCTFEGLTIDDFRELSTRIRSVGGVTGVQVREATGKLIRADVLCPFSADQLAERVVKLENGEHRILTHEVTLGTVKFRVR